MKHLQNYLKSVKSTEEITSYNDGEFNASFPSGFAPELLKRTNKSLPGVRGIDKNSKELQRTLTEAVEEMVRRETTDIADINIRYDYIEEIIYKFRNVIEGEARRRLQPKEKTISLENCHINYPESQQQEIDKRVRAIKNVGKPTNQKTIEHNSSKLQIAIAYIAYSKVIEGKEYSVSVKELYSSISNEMHAPGSTRGAYAGDPRKFLDSIIEDFRNVIEGLENSILLGND